MKYFRILIVIFSFLSFLPSCSLNTEVVKLHNEVLNENIYLRYFAANESSVISKNHFAETDTCSDIIVGNSGTFFYKLTNDSLIIYCYTVYLPTEENIRRNYQTRIKYKEMKNGNADFVDFSKVYKSEGFKFFPPSLEYMVQNN
jgi:hypothetical protein